MDLFRMDPKQLSNSVFIMKLLIGTNSDRKPKFVQIKVTSLLSQEVL